MRLSALPLLLALAACAGQPGGDIPVVSALPDFITGLPGEQPQFDVTGLAQAPTDADLAAFNNSAANVPALHAEMVCTQGYQRLGEATAPGDPVPFTVWRVRCVPYRPSL